MKKMKTVAESRKSMRIDLRPAVFFRTMTNEMFAVALGILFPLGGIIYFLKVKPLFIKAEPARYAML